MSAIVYPKKRIPLSVSLGITTKLAENDNINDEMFNVFSFEKRRVLLFNTKSMAFICKDNSYEKKNREELLAFLAVRRAYGLKNHSKHPVMIVVKNHKVGDKVATEFTRHTTDYKLFNMIYKLKDKISKELLVKATTKADFILITYNQLQDIVRKDACPAIAHIVCVNPITKYGYHQETVTLDDIRDGLNKHKRRKMNFTYIIDAKAFVILEKKDYQEIFDVDDCLFFGCKEQPANDSLSIIGSIFQNITREHYYFFILRELSRKRALLPELVERFKKTITYKLHLFCEKKSHLLNFDKDDLDKRVKREINKTLQLFNKKATKTIIGKKSYDYEQNSTTFYWEEPIETAPFLPLIEKRKDSYYYLTGLGKAVLIASANYTGIKMTFSSFLHKLSNTLFNKNEPSPKLNIVELLTFYNLMIGCDIVDLPTEIIDCLSSENGQSLKQRSKQLNDFIVREFGYIINDYSNHASLTLLEVFEEYLDEDAQNLLKQLMELKESKKKRRDEELPKAILRVVKNKPQLIGEINQKIRVDYNKTGRELKKLERKGQVIEIKTILSDGSTRLKYCQPEVLTKYPHLKKTCGICALYKKRFKKCPLYELLLIFHPTAFPTEYLHYVFQYISETTTACENIEEYSDLVIKGEVISYTITKEELEQKMILLDGSTVLGQNSETKYACVNCDEIIEEFGTGEELFFRRKKVLCPNCSTGYYKKSDKQILIKTAYLNILRKKCFEIAGSVPRKLEKLEPTHSYFIYEGDYANVDLLPKRSLALNVCNNRVPLEKVMYIHFVGKGHKELEEFLTYISEKYHNKYSFDIGRSKPKEDDKVELIDGCESLTPKQYQTFQGLVTFISENELLNNPILTSRNLTNIAGLLSYQKYMEEKSKCTSKINKQLYEMADLLMIAQSGVHSSYYGRQLEAQSQDCLFDLLKEEGTKVGLWTHGRVKSRLVKDPFLSSTIKISNARAPLDALLNQILRQFHFITNKIFKKVGLEPSLLGQGLFHRRKSKSDIDRKGFYFDVDEPVGTLAIISLLKAISDDLFSADDCSLELSGDGQQIYKVKKSSINKIIQFVEEALEEHVFYEDKKMTFLEAFEQNLFSLRKTIDLWLEKINENDEISSKKIYQGIRSAGYYPFVYCPAKCEKDLKTIFKFSKNNSEFFDGREEKVLAALEERNCSREIAMKKWSTNNGKRGKYKIKLTKHQSKEQERSLLIVLMMMYSGLEMNGFFGYYSTRQIKEILRLTQNQVQRILAQMVASGLLVKIKDKMQNYYQLNLSNETVHEILFSIGIIPSDDEDRVEELVANSKNVYQTVKKILRKIQSYREGLPVTIGWSGWEIPASIEHVIELVRRLISFYEYNN